MKFKDYDKGLEYNLNKILGSDFWADKDGDLYLVDEQEGSCHSIRPSDAVEWLLRRESLKNVVQVVCHHQPILNDFSAFYPHGKLNYLQGGQGAVQNYQNNPYLQASQQANTQALTSKFCGCKDCEKRIWA